MSETIWVTHFRGDKEMVRFDLHSSNDLRIPDGCAVHSVRQMDVDLDEMSDKFPFGKNLLVQD